MVFRRSMFGDKDNNYLIKVMKIEFKNQALLMQHFLCSAPTVVNALRFKTHSPLGRNIREYALKKGGKLLYHPHDALILSFGLHSKEFFELILRHNMTSDTMTLIVFAILVLSVFVYPIVIVLIDKHKKR